MNVHAPRYFVPPRPEPPAEELGLLPFFAAMRTNALQVWSKAAYEQDLVVGRGRLTGRLHVIVNRADAIHHVLVGNTANYHRPAAAIRIGRGQGFRGGRGLPPSGVAALLISNSSWWGSLRPSQASLLSVDIQ